MKRLFGPLLALVVGLSLSGVASAQHGKGKGKPATTGIDHAETKANAHGDRGIEKAEAKQARHKRHKKHHHHR